MTEGYQQHIRPLAGVLLWLIVPALAWGSGLVPMNAPAAVASGTLVPLQRLAVPVSPTQPLVAMAAEIAPISATLVAMAEPLSATAPSLIAMVQPGHAKPVTLVAMRETPATVAALPQQLRSLVSMAAGERGQTGVPVVAEAVSTATVMVATPARGWAPVVSAGAAFVQDRILAAQQTLAPPSSPMPGTQGVASLPAIPTPTAWATGLSETPAAENELLLVYTLDNQPMGDDGALLSAREGTDGKVYLPLQTVVASLGFPIAVNAPAGVARGWFINDQRTFELDVARGVVKIAGKELPLPPGAIQSEATELFVAAEVLNEWFPVAFNVERSELALYASSKEVLPFAARLARQRLWASRARGADYAGAPRYALELQQFSWPDLRLNYGLSGDNRRDELASTYNIQSRGMMLGMEGFLNLGFADGGYNDRGLTNASFRLMQQTPSNTIGAEWLGSLAGRSLELGDINIASVPLLANRTTGAGVAFSNAAPNFVSGLNDFVLQGEAPPGWDVEVYRNGSLTTFATVANDGRYRFTGLQLSSGMNDFRIVLYGPQGQREERTESFRVGPGLVGQGEVVYQVGALASNAPLIRVEGSSAPRGGSTVVLNTVYGLTDNLALTTGVANGPLGSAENQSIGASVGLRASLGNTFNQLDYAMLADGTAGYNARTSIRVLDDIDLGAFITRQASGTLNLTQAERVMGVDFADTVQLGETPFRYGLAYSETRYGRQPRIERLLTTQSWRLGGVNFNNSLGFRRFRDEIRTEAGNLEFSTRVAGLPLRGGVGYDLEGDDLISSVGLGTQVRLPDDQTVLSLAGNIQPAAGQGNVSAGVQRNVGPLTVALNSSYNSNQTFQAGVNVGMALASAGDAPKYRIVDARSEGFGYASADILVFADENNNGVRDAGEPVVPEVKLINLRSANTQLTNAQGLARFGDLLPNTEVGIQIDEESLPDLYLRPRNATHVLQTQIGYGGKVQLPLQRLGELGGQVVGPATDRFRDVTLWLSDANGAELQRVGTDDGGNFNFQPLPLGRYTLNAQLKGGAVVSMPVTLTKAAQVVDDVTVRLPNSP